MTTIRLTRALRRTLSVQMTDRGLSLLAGAWPIFGHGSPAELGEACEIKP
jgi:TPP-dependent trihydroxycyclohexane-1,2-dione (THcHDO) dehydratase